MSETKTLHRNFWVWEFEKEERWLNEMCIRDSHQTAGGSVLQDLCYLGHLHHKGGLTCRKVIRRADAGKDGIHYTYMALSGRNKGTDLRHQGNQRILAHIGRFARHVRAGDDEAAIFAAVQGGIVGYEQTALEHLLHLSLIHIFAVSLVALHFLVQTLILGSQLSDLAAQLLSLIFILLQLCLLYTSL